LPVKFVIMNDLHYQGVNPRGRVDDYPAAIEAKIREVFQVAERERARAILVAGDLFNTPGISIPVFLRFYRLLKESPCDLLTIHGSPDHDGLAASIGRTWYQVLVDTGIIHDVEVNPWTENGVGISGKGANPETDHDINDYLPPVWFKHSTSIHLAHGMLLERPPGHDHFKYTLIKNVAEANPVSDVLVCGHFHPGWGIKKLNKTLFVNPGALTRTSAAITDMERTVQIAILEIENDGSCNARLIPLQSAKPGHEVLSREHLETQALREEQTAEFMALLGAGEEFRTLEIDAIFERLAEKEGFPAEVLSETRRRYAQITRSQAEYEQRHAPDLFDAGKFIEYDDIWPTAKWPLPLKCKEKR